MSLIPSISGWGRPTRCCRPRPCRSCITGMPSIASLHAHMRTLPIWKTPSHTKPPQ